MMHLLRKKCLSLKGLKKAKSMRMVTEWKATTVMRKMKAMARSSQPTAKKLTMETKGSMPRERKANQTTAKKEQKDSLTMVKRNSRSIMERKMDKMATEEQCL